MALDFDAVADKLYGLAPAEFTAKRDTYASEARRAGDRDLAAGIKALKRPTASAWLANQLVRQRPELVSELLDLGAAMLDAQERLDGEALRRLSQRRRQLGATIAGAGRQVAQAGGQSMNDTVARELEATFDAALADPAGAEALRTGRLASALSAPGFGHLGVATPPERGLRRQRADATGDGRQRLSADRAAERTPTRALGRQDERRLRRAEEQADRQAAAARTAAEEQGRLETATEAEQEKLRKAIARADEHLQQLRGEASELARRLADVRKERRRAERAAVDAERRAVLSRRALEEALADRREGDET